MWPETRCVFGEQRIKRQGPFLSFRLIFLRFVLCLSSVEVLVPGTAASLQNLHFDEIFERRMIVQHKYCWKNRLTELKCADKVAHGMPQSRHKTVVMLCSVLVRPIYGYAISIVMYVISTTYSERIFSQAKCEIMCQVCRVIMQSMATCRPKILIGTKEISLNNVRTTLGGLVKNATRTVKFISARELVRILLFINKLLFSSRVHSM